jgi:hypothetical protein
MRTIMTLYVVAFSCFPQSIINFYTDICYIHLQIFFIEFFEDNIHSMRC